jgi:DNA-binding MarR family transcriptional regulator/N-acetylglutamate synthase-like GNAT family acetyltransferase
MDFYQQTGKMALGSRLRRLSEKFTEDAAKVYALYEVSLDPKWFPVFYTLSHREALSVTEIAQIIGHSHASVSQIAKEMTKKGFTVTTKSSSDARVSVIKLSSQGKQLIPKLEKQYNDVTQAAEELLSQAQYDLWKAIEEVEFLLTQKDFYTRVVEVRKAHESQQVEIIDYTPEFQEDFKCLNYAWIEKYFTLEKEDYQALNHPDEKILKPGGHIFMARYKGEIVGTCALIKLNETTYELAKMTVAEQARGRNIGWLLGQKAIQKARDLGAVKLFLESNTRLEAAINLYHKLGFQKVIGSPSHYARCNIQMELRLLE